jgi:hypothetical protein
VGQYFDQLSERMERLPPRGQHNGMDREKKQMETSE